MKARIYDRFDIFIVILGKVAHIFEGCQFSGGFLGNEASRCGFCGGSCLLFDGFLRNEATSLLELSQGSERFVEAALGGSPNGVFGSLRNAASSMSD